MVLGPFFEKAPSIINRPDGSVLFECMCNANPEPAIKWFLKDKELAGDRYVMKHKKQVGKYICTLIIKNPTQADQGIYKVMATNPHDHFVLSAPFTGLLRTGDKHPRKEESPMPQAPKRSVMGDMAIN